MLRCGIFCNGVFFVVNAKSCLVVKYKKTKATRMSGFIVLVRCVGDSNP